MINPKSANLPSTDNQGSMKSFSLLKNHFAHFIVKVIFIMTLFTSTQSYCTTFASVTITGGTVIQDCVQCRTDVNVYKFPQKRVVISTGNLYFQTRQNPFYPSGTQQDIFICVTCSCPPTLVSFTNVTAGVVGWYTCNSCFPGSYITGPFAAGTLLVNRCDYCPPNCTGCPNPSYCDSCNVNYGYYIHTTPGICPACSDLWGASCALCTINSCTACTIRAAFRAGVSKSTFDCCIPCTTITNCYNCNDGPICHTCDPGAYFNLTSTASGGQCIICTVFVPGCAVCIDGPVCTSCVYAWAFDLRSTASQKPCFDCTLIPNCVMCIDGPFCTQCASGYVFNTTSTIPERQCVPCSLIPNCATCIDGPICHICQTAYHFNTSYPGVQKQCLPCADIPNCATCIDGPICATCKPAHHFNTSSTLFQKQCLPCAMIPNCATCTDGPICITCMANHYFNLSSTLFQKQCIPCSLSVNCSVCMDGLLCSTCIASHYKNFSDTYYSCVPCTFPNCATCQDGPNCTQCAPNTYFDLANPANGCAFCAVTFPNCATCIDGPQCTNCSTGYYLNTSVTPSALCFDCAIFPNCSECMTSQPTCITCKPNFYHDLSSPNKLCYACEIFKCLTCDDGIICTLCDRNYITNQTNLNKTCQACLIDEYSFNNTCLKCYDQDSNCSECYYLTTSINCTLCKPKWIPDPSNWLCVECKTMISNCITCSDIENCTLCKYPYLLGPTNKCDVCEAGYDWLGGICTKPQGCVNSLPDFSKCLGCFTDYNFYYDPKTGDCVCGKGFVLKQVGRASICVSECGNQMTTKPDQECDDGNFREGDGCDKNCKVETGFECDFQTPSICSLMLNVTKLEYNYAFKYEGQNRVKFSFSVEPVHQAYKLVEWQKFLVLNISDEYFKVESLDHSYSPNTNEVIVEVEYKKSIQDLLIRATLIFEKKQVKATRSSIEAPDFFSASHSAPKQVSSTAPFVYNPPVIVSIPSQLSVSLLIKGSNSLLLFEDQSLLASYKASSIGFTLISGLILLYFFISAYFHKMIGLQTIQVLQFFYFITMIVEQKDTTFLKALNVLKYTAFGGYSDYQLFYGPISDQAEALTSASVHKSFLFVGLMKYFLLNVNLSLFIPFLGLIVFIINLTLKLYIRSHFLKTKLQQHKDTYTSRKRTTQWVYDHCVFPLINLFSMISFFCTILQLQSKSVQSTSNSQYTQNIFNQIYKTSFIVNVIFVFLTFFMISFQVFCSFSQYRHSLLTEQQKARCPPSTIEKLQHDENNPDKQNYKPGYVFVYLVYYFLVQVILMVNILIKDLGQYGLDLMFVISIIYLLIVWNWQPYHQTVNFHNKALKLNHFTVFFFTLTCQLFNRASLTPLISVLLIYASLALLLVITCCAFARLYIEYQFRKKLQEDPTLMDQKRPIPVPQLDQELLKLTKKQRLMIDNKYTLDSQIKNMWKLGSLALEQIPQKEQDRMEFIKDHIRKEIYSKNRIDQKKRLDMKKKVQLNIVQQDQVERENLVTETKKIGEGLSQKIEETKVKKDRSFTKKKREN